MTTAGLVIISYIAGASSLALATYWYGQLSGPSREKVQQTICNHDMRVVNSWSSDGLGIPYGYRYYTCRKCGKEERKFWYV